MLEPPIVMADGGYGIIIDALDDVLKVCVAVNFGMNYFQQFSPFVVTFDAIRYVIKVFDPTTLSVLCWSQF